MKPARAWLTRTTVTPDGTFGALQIMEADGTVLAEWVTLEDDWRENQPNVSCIAAGDYTLKRRLFNRKGYWTFGIEGVPGRSHILVHPGRTEEWTEGCVLIGKRYRRVPVRQDEDTGAKNVKKLGFDLDESQEAFDEFMKALVGIDQLPIAVRWNPDIRPASEPAVWP